MQTILCLALAATVVAQNFMLPDRPEGSFRRTQPENTTILTQRGGSEAVYPSPPMSGSGGWKEALEKARVFRAELTLNEKVDLVTGAPGPCVGNIYPVPRLNFGGLCLQDGPAGHRDGDYNSVFPAGVTIASSWDRNMIYARAFAMGEEFKGKGAHVALTPSTGPTGRSPYSGRNWEGFSVDPYLNGVAMGESVRGLQDAGVQATAKHFLLNEQESLRHPVLSRQGPVYESISSNVDDRTIHELYLWPFANAVKEGVAAVMCSYNRINGSYACQNSKPLNGLLKEELGFRGYVMSDWLATHSGVASVEAGLDMDMPGSQLPPTVLPDGSAWVSYLGGNLTSAVKNGTVDEGRLNDMVDRIMTPYFLLGQDKDFPSVDPSSAILKGFSGSEGSWFRHWNLTGEMSRNVRADHADLIRKHAAASTVLLKNKGGVLPLKAPKTIGVFGNDAGVVTMGPLTQKDFEFGTLAVGGGSGAGRFPYLRTPLEAISARAAKDKAYVQAWLNNTELIEANVSTFFATTPDVCLVFTKSWATEGYDRNVLDLDWHANEVVERVAKGCNNTVVVTHSPGVNVLPFADNPNITAILAAHYPGQESGSSIVDVLYGDINPSGRLTYTIAYNSSDYDFAPITTSVTTNGTDDWQSWFEEGMATDYRYFDAHDVDVRYEFGFGLSYTTFNLADLHITKSNHSGCISPVPMSRETALGGNPDLWTPLYEARVSVTNNGTMAGDAVVQLYLEFPDSAPLGTPLRQLRGFDKVSLEAGETSAAFFSLMRRDISYWAVNELQWRIPQGRFQLHAGFSSRNLIEVADFTPVVEKVAYS